MVDMHLSTKGGFNLLHGFHENRLFFLQTDDRDLTNNGRTDAQKRAKKLRLNERAMWIFEFVTQEIRQYKLKYGASLWLAALRVYENVRTFFGSKILPSETWVFVVIRNHGVYEVLGHDVFESWIAVWGDPVAHTLQINLVNISQVYVQSTTLGLWIGISRWYKKFIFLKYIVLFGPSHCFSLGGNLGSLTSFTAQSLYYFQLVCYRLSSIYTASILHSNR